MSNWKKIGECGVDSGTIMIVDPCYVLPDKETDKPKYTYDEFLKAYLKGVERSPGESEESFISRKNEAYSKTLSFGDGVISPTQYGDGCYPVYALYEDKKSNRPSALMIDFTGSTCEGCGGIVSDSNELNECENVGSCCTSCGEPTCEGDCTDCECDCGCTKDSEDQHAQCDDCDNGIHWDENKKIYVDYEEDKE